MNYLEKKKKAMMNSIASGGTTTTRVTTLSASGSNPTLEVTTDITQTVTPTMVKNKLVEFGNVAIGWRVLNGYIGNNFSMLTLGETEVNGQTTTKGKLISWLYNQTVDYEVIGNKDQPQANIVEIHSADLRGNNPIVSVFDENGYYLLRGGVEYNQSVHCYISSNTWYLKANQDVMLDNVVYHSGDSITQWRYNQEKHFVINIL